MISLVDHLNLAIHKRFDPILADPYCPSILKEQANVLFSRVELLTEQTADEPDVNNLQIGLAELRNDFEKFMRDIDTLSI